MESIYAFMNQTTTVTVSGWFLAGCFNWLIFTAVVVMFETHARTRYHASFFMLKGAHKTARRMVGSLSGQEDIRRQRLGSIGATNWIPIVLTSWSFYDGRDGLSTDQDDDAHSRAREVNAAIALGTLLRDQWYGYGYSLFLMLTGTWFGIVTPREITEIAALSFFFGSSLASLWRARAAHSILAGATRLQNHTEKLKSLSELWRFESELADQPPKAGHTAGYATENQQGA